MNAAKSIPRCSCSYFVSLYAKKQLSHESPVNVSHPNKNVLENRGGECRPGQAVPQMNAAEIHHTTASKHPTLHWNHSSLPSCLRKASKTALQLSFLVSNFMCSGSAELSKNMLLRSDRCSFRPRDPQIYPKCVIDGLGRNVHFTCFLHAPAIQVRGAFQSTPQTTPTRVGSDLWL